MWRQFRAVPSGNVHVADRQIRLQRAAFGSKRELLLAPIFYVEEVCLRRI